MKKSILFLFALVLIFLSTAMTVMAGDDPNIPPVLKLDVKVDPYCETNVTYIACLSPISADSVSVPVITFYCNGAVIAKVPINKDGTAMYRFWQRTGRYQAVAAWLNTPTPVHSNPVWYYVPF